MKPLGDPARHVLLVQGMARAAGLDPVALEAAGRLTQEDWAAMIRTCRGCTWAGDCEDWLARTDAVEVAPPTCLNRARLAALGLDIGG